MFLPKICTDCRKIDSSYSGGEEPEKDGRRGSVRSLCQDCTNAEWKTTEEEEDIHQKVHS
jgi:hypothetical protein